MWLRLVALIVSFIQLFFTEHLLHTQHSAMVSTHRNVKVRALLVKIRTTKMRTWELLAWNHNIGQHGINCSKGWLERKLGSLENALWSLRKDLEGRAGAWESETIEIMTSWVCFVSVGSRERENWVDRLETDYGRVWISYPGNIVERSSPVITQQLAYWMVHEKSQHHDFQYILIMYLI